MKHSLILFVLISLLASFQAMAFEFKDIAQIAAGKRHSCALKKGEVFCWGDNMSYQLGNLGNDSNIPKRVPNLSDAISVATGGQHSCALKSNGKVQCWGLNNFGQIGEEHYATNIKISSLKEITQLRNVQALTLGETHSCALTDAGEVFCWGDNSEGQLGVAQIAETHIPTQVPNLSKIIMISAGSYHTCALHTKGEVFCWGGNRSGQIGNKKIQDKSAVNLVQSIKNVIQIAAGGATTCAVTSDRSLACWGDNTFSQIGIENSLDNKNPKILLPGKLELLQNIVETVSLGENHACALTIFGSILCWGNNSNNNFQLGRVTKNSNQFIPIEVPNVIDIKSVSAGGLHTCALRKDGIIFCWGNNFQGQLGNGMFTSTNGRPYKVSLTSYDEKPKSQYYVACYYYSINNNSSEKGINKTIYDNSNPSFYWAIENEYDISNYLILSGYTEDGFFVETKLNYQQVLESCNKVIYQKNISANKDDVYKLYDFKAVFQEGLQDKTYPIIFSSPDSNNTIKKLVIFGDSLSDNGNLKEFTHYIPNDPYFKGRFSNGLVWNDYFSILTEVPILNYAYGGSKTKSENNMPIYKFVAYLKSGVRNLITGGMTNYVNNYVKNNLQWNSTKGSYSIRSSDETLYVIWIGGNDYLESMNSEKEFRKLIDNDSYKLSENIVDNIIYSVQQLQQAGARHIMILGLPDMGLTPEAILNNNYNYNLGKFKTKDKIYYRLSEISQLHNSILKNKIEEVNSRNRNKFIYYVDMNPYLIKMLNNINFIDNTDFNYDITYNNSEFRFYGIDKAAIQLPCFKGDFKRNPIFDQFSAAKNLFCTEKLEINFTKTLFWDTVHPTSYTHCLMSYAIHYNISALNLFPKPKMSLSQHKNYCLAGFYERKNYYN